MIAIPLAVAPGQFDLIVVLEDENLERIRDHDPAEQDVLRLPDVWRRQRVRRIQIGYLTPDEMREGMERLESDRNPVRLLQMVFARWKFRPEKGDNDMPYARLGGVS